MDDDIQVIRITPGGSPATAKVRMGDIEFRRVRVIERRGRLTAEIPSAIFNDATLYNRLRDTILDE